MAPEGCLRSSLDRMRNGIRMRPIGNSSQFKSRMAGSRPSPLMATTRLLLRGVRVLTLPSKCLRRHPRR